MSEVERVERRGGWWGSGEPDGWGKCMQGGVRNGAVVEEGTELRGGRDGLMMGRCNGVQALIKRGLVPYGKILDADAGFPTLTYNVIGRHQSRLVRTRVASNLSPWLAGAQVGEVYTFPISHGAGRVLADEALVAQRAGAGPGATRSAGCAGTREEDGRVGTARAIGST